MAKPIKYQSWRSLCLDTQKLLNQIVFQALSHRGMLLDDKLLNEVKITNLKIKRKDNYGRGTGTNHNIIA